MKIFSDEKDIQSKIEQNTSVSFELEPREALAEDIERMEVKNIELPESISKASLNDGDLFYHKSILVTTNWNNNDDVFTPYNVWNARHTPIHKPTNFNHQSSKIVGHITSNWAIAEDGEIIPDDIDIENLPNKYHIVTGAVIYKKFHNDPDYQKSVAQLIEEIKNKQQFVSMEVSFPSFDYAIKKEGSDEVQFIARAEDTAFLSKHLRVYGGAGVYENYRVGRVLKDMTFIGKAYTKKPANKESVIFINEQDYNLSSAAVANASELFSKKTGNKEEKNSPPQKSSVISVSKINLNGDNSMSDVLKDQLEALKKENASLASRVEDLQGQLSKADVEKYTSTIKELETELAKAKEDYEALAKKNEESSTSVKDSKKKYDELAKAHEELVKQCDELKSEKVTAARIAYFVEGEVEKAVATEKVETFSNLNDDQFKAVADTIIEAAKAVASTKTDENTSTASDNVSDTDLDNTTPEDDITIASDTINEDTDEQAVAIASLAEKITKNLSEKKGDK